MPRRTDSLNTAIYRYLLACRDKRLAVKTRSWYTQKLQVFRSYLSVHYQVRHLSVLTHEHIEAFLTALEEEVSQATIKGYKRALSGLFRWCVAQDLLTVSPMEERKGSERSAD